jgi:IclR family pca regulon transcriptional regulator
LSEVARRTGLSPAAARRSLITLSALGYVGQRDKRFHLKPRIMVLGRPSTSPPASTSFLQPDLRGLVERFGDASSVGTLDGTDVIYVAHVSVQRARRAVAVVGARYPALATSMGRVLMAGLPDEVLIAQLLAQAEVPALTSKTVHRPLPVLREEIARVQENGFATTVDQLDYGITALAVPIRDPQGRTVAALNTSGYTGVVTPESLVSPTACPPCARRRPISAMNRPLSRAAIGAGRLNFHIVSGRRNQHVQTLQPGHPGRPVPHLRAGVPQPRGRDLERRAGRRGRTHERHRRLHPAAAGAGGHAHPDQGRRGDVGRPGRRQLRQGRRADRRLEDHGGRPSHRRRRRPCHRRLGQDRDAGLHRHAPPPVRNGPALHPVGRHRGQ